MLSPIISPANNLELTNINATTTGISFDISWDNSWNLSAAPANWDAVWVFVKYQDCNSPDKLWSHLLISDESGDHTINGGILQVDAVSDEMGAFIRRSADGSGSVAARCTLSFATPFFSIANMNFEVIGIEVVYVPEGPFYVGDGSTGSPPNSQNSFGSNSTSSSREITGEGALSANELAHPNMGAPTQHAAIPAGFPKGYAGFYCMKYEVSQSQYTRFLNLLTYSQQANRTAAAVTAAAGTLALAPATHPNRNAIRIETPGSLSPLSPAVYGTDLDNNSTFDDGGAIACNYLSWNDLLAYLDWAALRPMTELEFEKAARGPSSEGTPLLVAYAWNTTDIVQADAGALTDAGEATEASTSAGDGLCAHNSSDEDYGPLRVGFAATASTDRAGAGASYYGIMELSGNVWEQCYHTGYNSGSGNGAAPIFTGVLGDGALDESGNTDAAGWGTVIRSIVRGGSWNHPAAYCQISNRHFITSAGGENAARNPATGGRGVRQY